MCMPQCPGTEGIPDDIRITQENGMYILFDCILYVVVTDACVGWMLSLCWTHTHSCTYKKCCYEYICTWNHFKHLIWTKKFGMFFFVTHCRSFFESSVRFSLSTFFKYVMFISFDIQHSQVQQQKQTHTHTQFDSLLRIQWIHAIPTKVYFIESVCISSLSVGPTKSKQFPFTTLYTDIHRNNNDIVHSLTRTNDTVQKGTQYMIPSVFVAKFHLNWRSSSIFFFFFTETNAQCSSGDSWWLLVQKNEAA